MDLADFSWYRGNLSWLPSHTIFLAKAGSHAYGTATPTSDLDLRGIAIAPKEFYLGNLHNFEQAECKGDPDVTIFNLKKFVQLATDCNPNIVETLFIDESDWIIPQSVQWPLGDFLRTPFGLLLNHRALFLSQKAKHTFTGYAISQVKRIRTHRKWLLNPPAGGPDRADFGLKPGESSLGKEQMGLIEARIRKMGDHLAGEGMDKADLDNIDYALVSSAVEQANIARELIPVIMAERRFGNAVKEWSQYQTWLATRNPKRSDLEKRFGYDTKHGAHVVRLLRMGAEILGEGKVVVKRPDAEELLAIRNGAWPFEVLEAWALKEEAKIKSMPSELPREPDRARIDGLLVSILEDNLY